MQFLPLAVGETMKLLPGSDMVEQLEDITSQDQFLAFDILHVEADGSHPGGHKCDWVHLLCIVLSRASS